jgi:hypothetical protein
MHPRAIALIKLLSLAPHPEGGFFREIFRSSSIVSSSTGLRRTAITSIYYLIPAGQVSKFHRVASDEIWHYLEGEPLELYTLDPSLATLETHLLGRTSDKTQPIQVVLASFWQAAMPTGAFTLAGCTVGPGFEYEDSVMLADDGGLRERVGARFPSIAKLL